MANEMRSLTFGGVTHPIEDGASIKSADMAGSNLQLKDADGQVRSTVVIPTGGGGVKVYTLQTSYTPYGVAFMDGNSVHNFTDDEVFYFKKPSSEYLNNFTTLAYLGVTLAATMPRFRPDELHITEDSSYNAQVPAEWHIHSPSDVCVLARYDKASKQITVLDSTWTLCKMSNTQLTNAETIGISTSTDNENFTRVNLTDLKEGWYTSTGFILVLNTPINSIKAVQVKSYSYGLVSVATNPAATYSIDGRLSAEASLCVIGRDTTYPDEQRFGFSPDGSLSKYATAVFCFKQRQCIH